MNIQLNELRRLMAQIDSLVGSVEVTGSIREARQCAEKARSATVKAVKIAAALDAQQLSSPPELPGEQELEAAGLGYPLSKEEAVKLWYSGFRSEVITVLEAWEAIGHDICMNPDKGELLDSLRNMAAICDAHGNDMPARPAPELERGKVYVEARQCANCRHIGINDSSGTAACHDCGWRGPEPAEDKCPGCGSVNCMAAACPECGARYELMAEAKVAAPAPQAGHVPEGYTLVPEHAGVDAIVTALYRRFKDWSARGFGPEDVTWCEVKADLLALVAQDWQVPQAWRDVQTERARQVASEGWTPEHDDEHSAGQMARAAACYALAGSCAPNDETAALLVSLAWPWAPEWWKPTTSRRDLMKAAALILAEMERLDRAAMPAQGGE